jgi:hypothetical protein
MFIVVIMVVIMLAPQPPGWVAGVIQLDLDKDSKSGVPRLDRQAHGWNPMEVW